MTMRVAIIGCGAVGSLHAACLSKDQRVEIKAVFSPDIEGAASFASAHHIAKVGGSLQSAIAGADMAIIASPSAQHFEQARECIAAGLHTLIELPACSSPEEAETLGAEAERRGVLVGCAHTARYLEPYAMIRAAIEEKRLGEIRSIEYVRHLQLRPRAWADSALVHHAAHAMDLVMQWCGEVKLLGCVANPDADVAQSTSILGVLPSGGPLGAHVSYESRLPLSSMVVVGTKGTIATDGFSDLRSDLAELQFAGDEQAVYHDAIARQDSDFVGACLAQNGFIPWAETIRLLRVISELKKMSPKR